MRAEFGVLGTALEEMREAQAALRDGIARRAPQREIDTLFERYNEAVDRYMEELRKNATVQQADAAGGGDARSTDEIQELLDAIEEANRIGDTEGARKALAQLAEFLENVQMRLSASAGGGSGDGEPMEGELSEEMKQSLEDMADLLGEQRKLKDETEQAERRNQQGQGEPDGSEAGDQQSGQSGDGSDPGQDTPSSGELAQRQGQLEEALEALSENLPQAGGQAPSEDGAEGEAGGEEPSEDGTAPGSGDEDGEDGAGAGQDPGEALTDARRAMERSEGALQRGDLDASAEAQASAIEALRRAGQGLAEQAGRSAPNGDQTAEGENSDPLGRENDGENNINSEADIDTRDNATRSRELLEELRRRASEQEREELERQYLERLLKRF